MGTIVEVFLFIMDKKIKEKENCSKPQFNWGFKYWSSEKLIRRPFISVIVIIFILILVPFVVLSLLRVCEDVAKNNGIQWLSLSGSLGNWFSFFGSYCGVIATVVLGILAVRLTLKQDQAKDYTDIVDLQLDSFCLYDLWRYYQPSCCGDPPSQRFILTFNITGLKAYYKIKNIYALWGLSTENSEDLVRLTNLEVRQERLNDSRVMLCFDDFTASTFDNTFNYFFRLGCYEHTMMPPSERRRKLKLCFEIHYSDNLSIRYVECEYCLEYVGIEDGHVKLIPVDHVVSINSRRKD